MTNSSAYGLRNNPFALLGVSTRDDRRRILESAESKSLELDEALCRKAQADLTNPRLRLGAEIAWLPGVSPKKASQYLSALLGGPSLTRLDASLPVLANLNLMAETWNTIDEFRSAEELSGFICEVALLFGKIEAAEVMREINEDRTVSGFPEIRSLDEVEAEITERGRYLRACVRNALNRMPTSILVAAMTNAVDRTTSSGEKQAPEFIDALVDSYSVDTCGFLEAEAANVHKLIDAIRTSAESKASISNYIDQLETVARNWDTVAQPIQLSAKSRGLDHDASDDLANAIRSLGIDLFNEHDLLQQSQRITALVQGLFAELPEFAERAAKDADALGEIEEDRKLSVKMTALIDECKSLAGRAENDPESADQIAKDLIARGPNLVAHFAAKLESLSKARDVIAMTLMRCALIFGHHTDKWGACIPLLAEALRTVSDPEIKTRINENLDEVRKQERLYRGLKRIKSAPSLRTVNGIGTTLYGATDKDYESGSHLSTYYFVMFGIPVFPICRYRVIPIDNGYRFLGKSALRTFDKWHLALSLAAIGWLVIAANVGS